MRGLTEAMSITIIYSISVNAQTTGETNEGLPSINNSNTFYTKGLLSTVLFPDYNEINQNLSRPLPSINQTSEYLKSFA